MNGEALDCIRWRTWFGRGYETASSSFTDSNGMTDPVPPTKRITQYNVDVMLHYVMLSYECFAVLNYLILCYVTLCCVSNGGMEEIA